MAYSSIAQVRSNDSKMVLVAIADAKITDRIGEADKCVKVDLSNVINFTLVTDTPTGCPNYINQLSQYKTMELSLVNLYGAKREAEQQTDRQYWANLYKILLQKIIDGDVDTSAVANNQGSFVYDVRHDIPPALGMGDDAGHIDDDELETQREDYGDT